MSDEIIRITLRIPEDLHELVVIESRDQRRSLNAQVLEILAAYFDKERTRVRLSQLERTESEPRP